MGGGTRTATVALGVAAVALLGYVLWPRNTPSPAPLAVVAPVAGGAVAPEAVPEAVPVVEVVPAPAPPEAVPAVATVAPVAPAFDNWRVGADGSSVVAGRAPAGSLVTVLVDGMPVAEARANARDEFVAMFTLPPNPNPSLMTLSALLADGSTLASSQTVALGAVVGPVTVALAEPAVDPAPEAPVEPIVEPPAAVLVTDEGVRVLQGATPEDAAVVAVSLDAIAYTAAGDVQLSGMGQAGQFIRLYLDGTPVATVPVGDAGQWSITLGDTPPGIYTLRVDQVDATGTVTARFETPFKRETREALAALVAPPEQTAAPTPEQPPPTAVVESPPEAVPPQPDKTKQPEAASANTGLADAAPSGAEPTATTALADSISTNPEPAPAVVPEVTLPPVLPVPRASPETAPVSVPEVAMAPDQPVPADSAKPVAPETPTDPPTDQSPPSVEVAANAPAAPDATLPAANAPALAEPAAEGAAPASPPSVSITVQPGYTLWGIARQQLGEGILYVQVFEANKDRIRNPDLIYPGQVFVLPTR